jgi:hypothetical protein
MTSLTELIRYARPLLLIPRSKVRILHGLSLGVHRLIRVTVVTGAGMTAAAQRASRFAT